MCLLSPRGIRGRHHAARAALRQGDALFCAAGEALHAARRIARLRRARAHPRRAEFALPPHDLGGDGGVAAQRTRARRRLAPRKRHAVCDRELALPARAPVRHFALAPAHGAVQGIARHAPDQLDRTAVERPGGSTRRTSSPRSLPLEKGTSPCPVSSTDPDTNWKRCSSTSRVRRVFPPELNSKVHSPSIRAGTIHNYTVLSLRMPTVLSGAETVSCASGRHSRMS